MLNPGCKSNHWLQLTVELSEQAVDSESGSRASTDNIVEAKRPKRTLDKAEAKKRKRE